MTVFIEKSVREILADLEARVTALESQSGPMTSVFGRSGAVVAQAGDYTPEQILGNGKAEALTGTEGTPSLSNRYVSEEDCAIVPTAERIPRALLGGYLDPGWTALRQVVVTGPATETAAGQTLYFCDVSAGAITINLPAPTKYKRVSIKLTTEAAHSVTVDPGVGTTIDAQPILDVDVDYAAVTLLADGSNWWRV